MWGVLQKLATWKANSIVAVNQSAVSALSTWTWEASLFLLAILIFYIVQMYCIVLNGEQLTFWNSTLPKRVFFFFLFFKKNRDNKLSMTLLGKFTSFPVLLTHWNTVKEKKKGHLNPFHLHAKYGLFWRMPVCLLIYVWILWGNQSTQRNVRCLCVGSSLVGIELGTLH